MKSRGSESPDGASERQEETEYRHGVPVSGTLWRRPCGALCRRSRTGIAKARREAESALDLLRKPNPCAVPFTGVPCRMIRTVVISDAAKKDLRKVPVHVRD